MSNRQIAMVIDLNKCIGCQACTAACKSLWTDEPGQEYMLWNNVETKPGRGYPKAWESKGAKSGWKNGRLQFGDLHHNYHFYLPRLCNHCTKPACLEACPVRAIYKREQDGIVLVDQDRCQGFRQCNRACPYDKVYFNFVSGKSQKCIFCFPRVEQGVAPACARQCPGRLRFVGFLEDDGGPIAKLVHEWKVALPLHPEFGTGPNVYYVPPMLPSRFDENGDFDESEPRVPMEYLRYLFGAGVDQALITLHAEMEKKQEGKASELMDLLIAREWKSLFNIPDVRVY
jgi:DMSO reductase family type II enzyme iron-sulfur subunit